MPGLPESHPKEKIPEKWCRMTMDKMTRAKMTRDKVARAKMTRDKVARAKMTRAKVTSKGCQSYTTNSVSMTFYEIFT